MSRLSLRRSEAILRLLIAFTLGVGLVGFATHGPAGANTAGLRSEGERLVAPPGSTSLAGLVRHLP